MRADRHEGILDNNSSYQLVKVRFEPKVSEVIMTGLRVVKMSFHVI